MQLHWNEWGFPGKDMLHLHSTPLQLAFDRVHAMPEHRMNEDSR
jgi:hypothetical protein